jgi:hypothetical protein
MIDWLQSNYWWLTLVSIWFSCFILYMKIETARDDIRNEISFMLLDVKEILEKGGDKNGKKVKTCT